MSDFTPLLAYQLLVTAVLCALLGICVWNLSRFQRLGGSSPLPTTGPSVSVLIPARNEERCIEACVRSLCTQTYGRETAGQEATGQETTGLVEVVVLDDGSVDGTPEILRRLQQEFPKLRVMSGSPLPEGWVGKSWACHQLAQQASGDILLFTDADTEHAPECIAATAKFVEDADIEFFSVIPYEVFGSFGEHVVIPMIHVLFLCYAPMGIIKGSRTSPVAAANGQFMCFTRSGYTKAGGHVGVHDSLVEDIFLAKNAKRAGLRMTLVDATQYVSCRMYENARQVTEGFSKNFFPATGYNLPFTIFFMMHVVTAFIVPVFFWLEGWYVLSVIQLSAAACIRLLIAFRFRMPWWHVFLQPVTAAWTVFIGLNSIRWTYSKQGVRWKGRAYLRGDSGG